MTWALGLFALLFLTASAHAEYTGMYEASGEPVISPDGRYVFVSTGLQGYGFTLDSESGGLSLAGAYTLGGVMDISSGGDFVYSALDGAPSNQSSVQIASRDPATNRMSFVGSAGGSQPRQYRDLQLSPDGRSLYTLETHWGDALAISVFTRDPATGQLTYLHDLSGPGSGLDMVAPHSLTVSRDCARVYAGSLVYARAPDTGDLTFVKSMSSPPFTELLEKPDGSHLFGGREEWRAMTRDSSTGDFTDEGPAGFTGGALTLSPPRSLYLTPDGATAYAVRNNEIAQLAVGDSTLNSVRVYRNGVDGVQGLDYPRGAAVSPDGRTLVVSSGDGTHTGASSIASFRRDPATGALSFVGVTLLRGLSPSPRPGIGVIINEGAAYTNTPRVKIRATSEWPMIFDFEVANNAGFLGAKTITPVPGGMPVWPWTLDTTGPERLPKTVYVRNAGGYTGKDEIVLDATAPSLVAVRVVATRRRLVAASARRFHGRVRITARDRTSGVTAVQVASSRARPGAWRRYLSTKTYPVYAGRVYVRVRDRAGNRSRWRTVKLPKRRA